MKRKLWLNLLLLALVVGLVACGGAAQPPTASAPKGTLKLAENPWTGSSVNVHVAKILLEKELNYQVEIVSINEQAQWAALATGDLSASLEVWPSGHAESIKQYIDEQQVVENIGELGVVGKIGWYIPSYLLARYPELITWEGLKTRADIFKTAETGEKGQFLLGDPSWVTFDADIINNLGLNLQVVAAGSEDAVKAAVDGAYSREEPILFYFWTPHSMHARYDLTEVALPAYSEECHAKAEAGGVDCAYPPDVLLKIAWAGLKDQAPDAYALLQHMNYTNADQIAMIADVELEGKTAAEAAQAWIDANPTKWRAWLEQK